MPPRPTHLTASLLLMGTVVLVAIAGLAWDGAGWYARRSRATPSQPEFSPERFSSAGSTGWRSTAGDGSTR